MFDYENLNTPATSDDDIRPIEGLREDDPEYVRDLLTRLKEEMEGIRKEEAEASRLSRTADHSPIEPPKEDDAPYDADEGAQGDEDIEVVEDDDISFATDEVPVIAPVPTETVQTSSPCEKPLALEKPTSHKQEQQAVNSSAWEELTMDALIDDLIAEKRAKGDSASLEQKTERADLVTDTLFSPLAEEAPAPDREEPKEEAAVSAIPEPAEEESIAEVLSAPAEEAEVPIAEADRAPSEEEPEEELGEEPEVKLEEEREPIETPVQTPAEKTETAVVSPAAPPAENPDEPMQPPKPVYDGIWAVAAAANAPTKKRKVYHARLLRREGLLCGAAPRDAESEIFEPITATEAPYCEPAAESEGIDPIGTLRPQDFFIADLREEHEITSLDKADEYVSRNQIEGILNAYAAEKKQISLRFVFAVLLSSFLLVFENLPLLGVDYAALLGLGARVCVLLDVGLLLAVALLASDRLREGATELFAWEFGSSAITLVAVATSFIASVLALGIGAQILLSLPAAIAVTLSLFFKRLQILDDERTFLLLCESGDKLAAETIPAFCATEEIAVLGRRIREVVRIKKVGFVTGYFARTKQKRDDYRLHTLLTLSAFGCLLLTTILCLLTTKHPQEALSLGAWLLAPLSLSVMYSARRLPFHHLVDNAEVHGTAVLGEASAEDYGKVDAIAFEDVEAFRSNDVFVHQIKLYENGRLDELLYDLAGVFSVLGGPLDAVFRVAAAELGMPNDVVLIATGPEGLEATVEGVRISLGKWAHFRTEVISPYYDSEDTYREDSGEFSIMYVAIEGVIRAKVYLKYAMNEHFERNVRRLQRNGVRSLIRSYDPNIGDSLVAAASHSTSLRVKVVRKKPDQLHDFAETRVDSGLVTSAGSRDLLYTLFMCQNYRKAIRALGYCKAISVPLSVLAAICLPLLSHTPFASVYGAAIGLFWLIPVHFISRFYFKKER